MRETARAATVPAGGLPLTGPLLGGGLAGESPLTASLGQGNHPLPFYSKGANP